MRKLTAPMELTEAQERQVNNLAMGIYAWGVSTGKVKPNSPEEMQDGYEWAMNRAKRLSIVRGVFAFGAPSAPTPQMVVKDKSGNLQVIATLRKKYYERLQETNDYEGTLDWFLDTFGADLYPVLQSTSFTVVQGMPVTKKGLNWLRRHKGQSKDFPVTIGYFAPPGDPDDFDYEAWRRQMEEGQRAPLTVKQYAQLANHRVGSYLYQLAREAAGPKPNDEQRRMLGGLFETLKAEFPGFHSFTGLPDRPESEQVIDELHQAVRDPKLKRTETGQAAAVYLEARDAAMDVAERRGLSRKSFATAKSMRDVQDMLYNVGSRLSEEYPAFSQMWSDVFSWELNEAIEEMEEAA